MKEKQRVYVEDTFDLEALEKRQASVVRRKKVNKKNMRTVSVLKVLIVICAFAVAYLIYSLANGYIQIWRSNNTARQIQDLMRDTQQQTNTLMVASVSEPDADERVDARENEDLKPSLLRTMREALGNDDVVGYLVIAGADIEYPVVQAADNIYYLGRDARKESNIAGAVFMDFENTPNLTDFNTVLYAHNMRDGSMFGFLKKYRDPEYFGRYKSIDYYTDGGITSWEAVAFFETDTDFDYIRTKYADRADFYDNLLLPSYERTMHRTEHATDITDASQLLTLSTCTNSGDTRYVLQAVRKAVRTT